MAEASLECLQHLLDCLALPGENCQFSIITNFMSHRHRVVIDNRTMLIEDYQSVDGNVVPEQVCVLDVSSDSGAGEMLTAFKKTVRRHRTHAVPIEREDIEFHLREALKFVKKEAKSRRKKIRRLRATPKKDAGLLERLTVTHALYQAQRKSLKRKLRKLRFADVPSADY